MKQDEAELYISGEHKPCKKCGNMHYIILSGEIHNKLECRSCGAFIDFVKKERNKNDKSSNTGFKKMHKVKNGDILAC